MITPLGGWGAGPRRIGYERHELPETHSARDFFRVILAFVAGVLLTIAILSKLSPDTVASQYRALKLAVAGPRAKQLVATPNRRLKAKMVEPMDNGAAVASHGNHPAIGKRFRLADFHVSCVASARLLSGLRGLVALTCRTDRDETGLFPKATVVARGTGLYEDGQSVVELVPTTWISSFDPIGIERNEFHTEARIIYPGDYSLEVGPEDERFVIPFTIPKGRTEDVNRDWSQDVMAGAARARLQMDMEGDR